MKEDILDVLMYLFENYYMDDDIDIRPDRESLQVELLEVGFPPIEVGKAFDWLEGLAAQHNDSPLLTQNQHAIRLFTDQENDRLDVECRGFLMFIEQMGILNPHSRELVIDRVMALDAEDIDIDQLKWVILMVLFNQPGQEAAYTWIEDLVFEEFSGSIH
ncbi:MAG: DUF494 domain-containing protein [Gammaproteobacteria bacterium]|nr:DUF494 domain-containing protein [Gammaproteobacteria bacterium]